VFLFAIGSIGRHLGEPGSPITPDLLNFHCRGESASQDRWRRVLLL
jgi:hypothetical protein